MKRKNQNPDNDLINKDSLLKSQEDLDKAATNNSSWVATDGIVGERVTGSSPNDTAGVSDLDTGMRRGTGAGRRR